DHSPKEIRELLDKDSLVAPSCHLGYDVIEKKWSEALEAAKIIGHSCIICPGIDEKQRTGPDGWKRAADLFNKAGEESQKAGIQFGYHNHSFEFQPADSLGGKLPYDFLLAETDPKLGDTDPAEIHLHGDEFGIRFGKLPYDFLLAETDPKLVAMEMDLCWISVAGKDPIAYFDKYPGRFPLVHVKDWVKDASSNSGYQ